MLPECQSSQTPDPRLKLKRILKTAEAVEYVGGIAAFRDLSPLLAPWRKTPRLSLYDKNALDAAIDSVAINGWPLQKNAAGTQNSLNHNA